MKATSTLLPRASSPVAVAGPVGEHLARLDLSPSITIGRWLMQVFWFERLNLISR